MPIVLSSVGVGYGFNGPTVSSLLSELDGIEPIDRNCGSAGRARASTDRVRPLPRAELPGNAVWATSARFRFVTAVSTETDGAPPL